MGLVLDSWVGSGFDHHGYETGGVFGVVGPAGKGVDVSDCGV